MRVLQKQLKHDLMLMLFSSFLATYPAMAATDTEAQQSFLRAKSQQHEMDHSAHEKSVDDSQAFHGIFYGFMPCNDCPGVKTTLSLKNKNNYLIVTQFARESSREYYERGKYTWDEKTHLVVLTPSKGGDTERRYQIENKDTLILLDKDGKRFTKDPERYIMRNSDTVKTREVHIH